MNKIMKNLTIVGIIFAFAFAGFITGQGGLYENGNLEAADPDSKG